MDLSGYEISFLSGVRKSFQVTDYVFFILTLAISAAIGFFYAIKDRKQHSTKEFLLAGGNMSLIPVSLSLLASFMSAIALLGVPVEMYRYGTMYMWFGLAYVLAMGISAHVYVPIFYNLRVTSVYEYLELRFCKSLRTLGTIMFTIQMPIYMAVVLYAPSLAINAVTGLSIWGSLLSVAVVCTLYTTIGGMKTVLWTDTVQALIMFAGLLAALIQGSIITGGFANAWNIAAENHRVFFTEFSFDPTVRHTVWGLVLGGACLWVSIFGTNQAQVQRIMTVGTLKRARIAVWINAPGLVGIVFLCSFIGIVMYAFYSKCDPLEFKLISAYDQMFPLFVMDVLGHIPGIPGLFVACICSGTLSTISSGLNSLAAVVLQDLIKPYCAPKLSDERATLISKILVIVFGGVCLALTFIASLMGHILQAGLALFGVFGAPMLGLFTLGILFPWANKWGGFAGLSTSFILMLWIGVGKYIHQPIVSRLPVDVSGCNWNVSATTPTVFNATSMYYMNSTSELQLDLSTTQAAIAASEDSDPVAGLYTLSYIWYSPVAVSTVLVVGLIVSFITGRQNPEDLDPRLICPVLDALCPWLPKNIRRRLWCGVKHDQRERKEKNAMDEEDGFFIANGHMSEEITEMMPMKATDNLENGSYTPKVQNGVH